MNNEHGPLAPGRGAPRRATMLLLALFFIVVTTSLATLILANSSQLIRTTRNEHEELILRQLTDSGWAWVLTQEGRKWDSTVTLPGEGVVPDGSQGKVSLALDDSAQGVVVITVEVAFPRHKLSRTTRFRLPI